ncbi:uncharacterized protein LOC114756483 [Neltuma alba]|uniref:uncharacterized protein LOC114756483 n=1 Tax=Neltuma alba TaxID=207710 RepID=UPI0010A5A050|nr:uncharacterized protein LOC114756483 [Prosopis alba]
MEGFQFRLLTGDALTSEIWGCLMGLKRAWDGGFKNILLKSDSQEMLSLCQNGAPELHESSSLISEIQEMMQRDWKVSLLYIERDSNRRADKLAKRGLSAAYGLQLFGPTAMEQILHEDTGD